jgi:hypothetical protein
MLKPIQSHCRPLLCLIFAAACLPIPPALLAQPAAGLRVHWKLDETSGATANDASLNNVAGTLANFPADDSQWVPGKNGGALRFANSSYVAAGGLAPIQSTTWAAWVSLTATPNNGAVISSTFAGATAGHSLGFGSAATAMQPRVVWNHNTAATILLSPTPVQMNEWNHVAVSYDAAASSLKLYVNGEQKAASTAPAASTAFTTINLGRREASANTPLTALIDDVVVYDRALTLEELQQLAGKVVSGPPVITRQPRAASVFAGSRLELSVQAQGLLPITYQWRKDGQPITDATESVYVIEEASPAAAGSYSVLVTNPAGNATSDAVAVAVSAINLASGLQAHWKFDETSGLTAADATPNANTGALDGFAGDDSQWVQGEQGGAIAFNGASNVQVPDSASIGSSLVNGFTVSTWFRSSVALPAAGGTRTPRMLEKGNSYFFLMNPGTGGMNFLVKRASVNYTANLVDSIEANRWYHITGTFDGTSIRVYLDGELKGTTVVGGPIDDGGGLPLFIGSDDAGAFFNGAMDDLRIWNRPLNRTEIRNVMGRDLAEPPSFTVQPKPVTRFAGSTAQLSVDVRGQEPFRFLWYRGDEEIRAATGRVLALENVQPSDAGIYKVKVSNALGEAFSQTAVLTVTPVESLQTGLAAQWKFNETTGLVAADSSPNQRNAELAGYADATAHWVPGQAGGALALDGVLNQATVPNSGSFALDGEATIAFWINPATYGTEQSAGTFTFNEGRVIRKPGHFDVLVVDNPGGVRRTIILNGVSAPQGSLELNAWQHFTIVLKGGMVQFHKNGFPIGESKPVVIGGAGDQNIAIGNFDDTGATPRYFNGRMDELAIWQRPLSESEILEIAGKDIAGPPVIEVQPQPATRLEGNNATFSVIATGKRPVTYQWFHNGQAITGAQGSVLSILNLAIEDMGDYSVRVTNSEGSATSAPATLTVESLDHITSGLIAYWNFDESQGSKVIDRTGKGNDGDLQNFTAVPGVAGTVGGAFDFDGTDDFIVVPHQAGLNLTDQGTISAWINPRSHGGVGGLGRIVRKSVNYDLTTTTAGGGTLLFYGINKTAYQAPNAAIALNGWQHVAIVLKDGLIQYYKDGQALGAPISGLMGEVNADPLIIGNFQNDLVISRLFNGLMDEVGIWSRALTPGDLGGIYQNGLAGRPLTATFEPLHVKTLSVGAQVQLTFYSPYSNRQYAVQTKTALGDPAWADQTGVQFAPGADNLTTASFTASIAPHAFYRIVALPVPPVFADGFESGAAGWTHGGTEDNWELGTPTQGPMGAHSGVNVYGTGLGSNYREFTDSFLNSPVIDLRTVTRGTLTFWEWRNTDIDPVFHGTVVNVLDADSMTILEELSRASGPSGGWQLRTIKLGSNSLGKRIILQFTLYSDHQNLREGWFLDDIAIHPE